ncbi:MAG: hypothetical protein NTU66_07200 [Elusimicrobia bacterium]|nr:hypothetical protein [Elusimicrobiota bacterium]
MKAIQWNPLKNDRLKQTRGVSFEELLNARLITMVSHPVRSIKN